MGGDEIRQFETYLLRHKKLAPGTVELPHPSPKGWGFDFGNIHAYPGTELAQSFRLPRVPLSLGLIIGRFLFAADDLIESARETRRRFRVKRRFVQNTKGTC